MALQHLRSSTANKRPVPGNMSDGQLGINTNTGSPGLFFKDSNNALVKVGPVHVGTTAPNASPASGGTAGNSVGEQWLDTSGGTYVFKVWDGSAWRSESGTFVDVNGDVMTGALGIIAGSAGSPGLYFSGDTNTGIYSPGANQVAISTNGTGRLFVDASGNVGIGTTSPTDALQVANGNILIGTGGSSAGYRALYFGSSASASARFAYIEKNNDSPYDFNIVAQSSTTAASAINFKTTPTATAATIDSSGRLLVGTSSARTLASYGSAGLQVESTAFATASISAVNNQNTADGVALMLGKSRGAAVGSFTIVQSGDQIGGIYFQGADGAAMRNGASVVAVVDASPAYASTALVNNQTYRIVTVTSSDWSAIGGPNPASVGNVFTATGPSVTSLGTAILNAGNMPGRLVFSTTADGSVSPTERMRITSAGLVGIGTSSPQTLVDLAANNDGATGTTANNTFRFTDLDTNTAADQPIGKIEWYSADTSSPGARAVSYILSAAAGANSGGDIRFGVSANAGSASEAARIDSSGRLLVGTSSALSAGGNSQYGLIQVEGNSASGNGQGILTLARGAAPGSITTGQTLGMVVFSANNGGEYGEIRCEADGVGAVGDYPGRLTFSTTADGASSPTERMRITQSGAVLCGTTTTPTGAGSGSLVAQDRLVLAAEGAGRVQIRAGDTGTVTASTGTVVFRFKSNTASINLSAFVKITISQRANSTTASNSPAAEYCFQLHQNSSNAISLNGATTIFEYTYVRASHFAFADAGSNECTVTMTNPTSVSLAGSYKVEIMSHAGLWVLQSVSST